MSTPAEPLPTSSPTADPQVCGRLVAWFATALADRIDASTAIDAIGHGSDGQVAVGWTNWPDTAHALDAESASASIAAPPGSIPELGVEPPEHDFADVFTRLLGIGVRHVSLVLPVAGDPLGLTGTGSFARAALEAEAGVVMKTPRATLGLIPTADQRGSSYRGTRWRIYVDPAIVGDPELDVSPSSLGPDVDPLRVIEHADRELSRALRDATVELDALDLAHWRPEAAAGRKAAEVALRAGGQRMPVGWPAPARALAERALMLWHIVKVARADAGATSAAGINARTRALSDLSHAVREAAMVAYNVPVATLPINGPGAFEADLARRPPA